MTSMQSLSGAGRSPGVSAMDILDNIVPYIPKEEEKVEKETQKILGKLRGDGDRAGADRVSCTCTRVNVLEGHTESVFVELRRRRASTRSRRPGASSATSSAALSLPSAPKHLITVQRRSVPPAAAPRSRRRGRHDDRGRPAARGPGAADGVKYMLVSHNTRMGAAKGAILIAEYLTKKGYIK